MAEEKTVNVVEQSIEEATGRNVDPVDQAGLSIFSWITQTADIIAPWWSRTRDRQLASIWKKSNHLSTAIYNTQAKIVGIPPRIEAKDPSLTDHVAEAEEMTRILMTAADFGRGWVHAHSKFVEDLITQDNGAFYEIVGEGPADGPVIGRPLAVIHRDSSRCTRTGDPIFPVLYEDLDGKLFKLHWTRVIYMAQMPSPLQRMYGVGFCSVSRVFQIAQSLTDMIDYKLERLGSRPLNQILLGKGITGLQIMQAIRRVEEEANNLGHRRFGRTVAMGSENPDIGLERLDLTHMEPFDEEVSTNLGMYVIAAALGMDADEIWPVSGRGSSQGEADLRRMRSRGRLPAQLTSEIAHQFNFKFVPQHLRMVFDFQDDVQDQQRAVISDIRGRNRERDMGTGTINVRSARLQMVTDKDVDQNTFENMELVDGRLPDGTTIGILFFDEDPVFKRLLTVMPNPLAIIDNISIERPDPITGIPETQVDDRKVDEQIAIIQRQREVVLSEWAKSTSSRLKIKIKKSYWALDWLEEQYNMAAGRFLPPVPMQQRRLRQDIRVVPEEVSTEGVSAAQTAAGDAGENIEIGGG